MTFLLVINRHPKENKYVITFNIAPNAIGCRFTNFLSVKITPLRSNGICYLAIFSLSSTGGLTNFVS